MRKQNEKDKQDQIESKENAMSPEEREEAVKREKVMIRFRQQILHPN